MIWKKQPITRQLAKELRKASVSQPDLNGHSFKFTDLKQLWQGDPDHVLLTHDRDQVWQYWYKAPVGGWQPISIHDSMEEGQDAVAAYKHPDVVIPPVEDEDGSDEGTFVLFRSDEDKPWHSVRVLSRDGAEKLSDMYERMGFEHKIETTP
jgi:hypothetical protein